MKTSNNFPSVWPGYVAAVASLVLSLLLLLAILMVAIVRGQGMVKQRYEEITSLALSERVEQKRSSLNSLNMKDAVAVAHAGSSQQMPIPSKPITGSDSEINPYRKGALHLSLIFETGASSLPNDQLLEIVAAMHRQQVRANTPWVLSVQVPEFDPVFERAAYNLMLLVRSALLEKGVSVKDIRLQIQRTKKSPPGYEKGEITIHAVASNKPDAKVSKP